MNGLLASALKVSTAALLFLPAATVLASMDGVEAITLIAPVFTSTNTAAARRSVPFCRILKACCCALGSMVVLTLAPPGFLPTNSSNQDCTLYCLSRPSSRLLKALSTPKVWPLGMKTPVIGQKASGLAGYWRP